MNRSLALFDRAGQLLPGALAKLDILVQYPTCDASQIQAWELYEAERVRNDIYGPYKPSELSQTVLRSANSQRGATVSCAMMALVFAVKKNGQSRTINNASDLVSHQLKKIGPGSKITWVDQVDFQRHFARGTADKRGIERSFNTHSRFAAYYAGSLCAQEYFLPAGLFVNLDMRTEYQLATIAHIENLISKHDDAHCWNLEPIAELLPERVLALDPLLPNGCSIDDLVNRWQKEYSQSR